MNIKNAIETPRKDTEIKATITQTNVGVEIHGDKLGAMLGVAYLMSMIVMEEDYTKNEIEGDLETMLWWARAFISLHGESRGGKQ